MRGDAEPDSYVYVTDEGVTRHYSDGSVDALAWEDVVEVQLAPSGDDVLFVLLDREGQSCVVPHSATDATFFDHLRHLPEFDLEALPSLLRPNAGPPGPRVIWRIPEPFIAPPELDLD
ncbi:hypothetical protein [Bailinhaonella thermotolerans]|uniref:Uncharacterized protein n=1 Tax=Bailinhaonella thermotolerans TaxID=1070861 RepID=A0A3A4B4Q5_9ACTN|nr:hypothetical protein [Bailinhaonella thermotolerans]RJL33051.1 hypothetical protein D5H75_09305 [Bailinhaonella thermotolerans]